MVMELVDTGEPREIAEARAAASVGRLQEAVGLLGALTDGPQAPLAHKVMGDILAQSRHDAEAAKAYRRAVRLDAGFAEAHNNLANVLWRASKDMAAVDHYRQAIALKPDYG